MLLESPEKGGQDKQWKCQCILVLLDGDPEHEAGLDMAVELSKICQAKLQLVVVIHELSTLPGEQAASAVMLPNVTSSLLDLECEEADLFLVELM